MTATTIGSLSTMPWTRLLPVERLPLSERRRLLTWLAQSMVELKLPPEAVDILRGAWAHDSVSGPELDERWRDFLARLAVADAADHGLLDWDWSCGSCGHPMARGCLCSCCPSASEQAHRDAEEALDVLAGGVR